MLRVAFIMDNPRVLEYGWDTSISIMEEVHERGHEVHYLEPSNLFFQRNTLWAITERIIPSQKSGFHYLQKKRVDLRQMDAIFIRKNPPFDLSYLYLTQMLSLIEESTFIINSADGLRRANEKGYILNFKKVIPQTCLSNQADVLAEFIHSLKAEAIVKPLDNKGGSGVALIPRSQKQLVKKLKKWTDSGSKWLMAQRYLHTNTDQGDKRILLLNGELLGQFQRKPKRGEFRSNLSLGGSMHRARITKRDQKIIAIVKERLQQDGLYFVGLDVVDGCLIELNVTSPAGIPEINALDGKWPQKQVVDFLEEQVVTLTHLAKNRRRR